MSGRALRSSAKEPEPQEEVLGVRRTGILLHPTSLPGAYGVGDVGPASLKFLDWMHKAGANLWQFLPLNPHGHAGTPYAVPSAMAASPAMIAIEPLLEYGLIKEEEVSALKELQQDKVNYDKLTPIKRGILRLARDRFRSGQVTNSVVDTWKDKMSEYVQREGKEWLEDYALFMALREANNKCWIEWPEAIRDRKKDALDLARQEYADSIDEHYFNQFVFAEQWGKTRARAAELGIKLVGDIPIFVAYDSADVWANRKIFKLDKEGKQTVQAGVPPDYFSATGQLWGNPLYNWTACAKESYKWWTLRFRRTMDLADIIRIDHFRGFQAAWEVPIEDNNAIGGSWVLGPGTKVFNAVNKNLQKKLPIIAEDLGLITKEVTDLREELEFPGMRVLQFAWDSPTSEHLPHNVEYKATVMYTGTHDNDTVRGFASKATPAQRRFIRDYLGRTTSEEQLNAGSKRKRDDESKDVSTANNDDDVPSIVSTASWDMIRLCLSSSADTAIVQMQDILDLDSDARMNTPATTDGNWSWRVKDESLFTEEAASILKKYSVTYGRYSEK